MSDRSRYFDSNSPYQFHEETSTIVGAPANAVFSHMDDHARLAAHMSESSWTMAGSSMQVEFDIDRGQKVGSWIRLSGKIFGFTLFVEEVVRERTPPHRKVWETIGVPRLIVIGSYRMGFEVSQCEGRAHLTVFIDYSLPEGILARWLGYVFGGYYARWCTQRMVADSVKHFPSNTEGFVDGYHSKQREVLMNKLITAVLFMVAIGLFPLMAQEKKEMPMKEGIPMKGEGMQGGMHMGNMKEMHNKMTEMKKGMGGTMKGQGMLKSDDM